jgi:predicted nucleic acid binding AN1-type Zn finger protein
MSEYTMVSMQSPVMSGLTFQDPAPMNLVENKAPKAVDAKRCNCCRKKLMLSDLACSKCCTRFCNAHRMPELHKCGFDFRKEGRDRLEQQLVKVVADRVEKI